MGLWIAMAVLAAAASLSVLMPLYRGRGAARSMAVGEISVYRDQLDEVDRDLERGLIAGSEATAARTEIARRLIRADASGPEAVAAPESKRRRKLAAALAAVGVPVVAVGLYLYLGSPDMPDAPLTVRLSAPDGEQDLAVLIARVEAHLAANPDDGSGWEVIAPVYARLGRADLAAMAYANVLRLLGGNAEREANFGEALVEANDGMVTPEARSAFDRARDYDPDAVRPRFYLALGLAQEGKTEEAATVLEGMITDAPDGAPWVPFVEGLLAQLDAAPPIESGPGPADVEAAAELSAEDRTAMIEGMVDRLAARLDEDPNDAAGWARLIRSYMVLGQADAANAALAKARSTFAGDSEPLALVEAEARAVGLIEQGRGNP